ncbi:hypothetical protein POM88_033842 [Heracleum sosnowskyi]|uniref:Uncharacterized protein n=1 Tax=Heracleum sosnowskyi TaxID=360622 RepID=A0AAD8HKJ0_9APIA|nr:hypothetical protein POM88_033842 [Heracleum sosnowskyi]
MEKVVDSLKKRVEELEKNNKELEKSKKMLELQLSVKESLLKLLEKQMIEKSAFYSNAFQSLTSKDEEESKLLLENNEKIVLAIWEQKQKKQDFCSGQIVLNILQM